MKRMMIHSNNIAESHFLANIDSNSNSNSNGNSNSNSNGIVSKIDNNTTPIEYLMQDFGDLLDKPNEPLNDDNDYMRYF